MGKAILRKFYLKNTVGIKVSKFGMHYSLTERKELFLSVYVDDIKLAGKKQNIDPMWKILMKDIDLGEPTSFLDRVYFGLHSKRMSDKQRCCRQLPKYVRIQDLCRS